MAQTFLADRRVSGVADRRRLFGRGGRRRDGSRAAPFKARVPCPACGVAWAGLVSFGDPARGAGARYGCSGCGQVHDLTPSWQVDPLLYGVHEGS
jgi:hypothetical protein